MQYASCLFLFSYLDHISSYHLFRDLHQHRKLCTKQTMAGDYQENGYYPGSSSASPVSLHLCFLISILFFLLGLSWYLNYESAMEGVTDQLKLVVLLIPLVLLLVVHWLSSEERSWVPFFISLPERDSFHRAGSSPWGMGVLLVFLLLMVSYQSSLQESWFPLLSR